MRGDDKLNDLRNLTRNIKNWSFSQYPKLGIDKNEAAGILEDVENIKAQMCDVYCRYPDMAGDQEKLDLICKECPLNTL